MSNAKKWFFMTAGLAAGFAVATAILPPKALREQRVQSARQAVAEAGVHPAIGLVRLADRDLGFGPEMEAILPATRDNGPIQMLNLNTGRFGTTPGLENSIDDVPALVNWIRTHDVNISGRVWPGAGADCITYNMTVVPVEPESWEKPAAEVMRGLPVPEPNRHSPRRWLVVETGRTATYAFRTDTGTLGILRLVGVSDDGQGVRIRYKLVQGHLSARAFYIDV